MYKSCLPGSMVAKFIHSVYICTPKCHCYAQEVWNVGPGWLFIPDVSIFRQGDLYSNDEDACSRQPGAGGQELTAHTLGDFMGLLSNIPLF